MNKQWLACLPIVACLLGHQANAQPAVPGCPTPGSIPCTAINANYNTVTASVSASITGFTPATTGTPISVTTGGVTGSLPAGAVVVASNVGATNGAYCKLGASATTADQLIPPNSWFAFTVGAATQLTCITSTSTTTVNMAGGSGLPTGAGGGGGGSGGGAITVADGADVTQGAIADAAYSGSGSGTVVSILKYVGAKIEAVRALLAGTLTVGLPSGASTAANQTTGNTSASTTASQTTLSATALGAPGDSVCGTATGTCSLEALIKFLNTVATAAIPAGTNLIGNVGSLYPAGSTPITASATGTTAATTATLAGTSGKTTYICGFSIRANATASATADSTVTGTVTGTLHYTQWTAPLASGIGLTEQIFSPCVTASGTNTGIAVISAAPGSGGVVSVSSWGFQF